MDEKSGKTYKKICDVKGTEKYTDKGLTPSKAYSYYVKAYIEVDGEKSYSEKSVVIDTATSPSQGKSLVNEVDLTNEIQNHLRANNVMVIDIARLDGNTQSFVFGSVTRAIYDLKLDGDRSDIPDKIIVFVDELNKYASSDAPKNSPILNQVLDIAERGRSLGIILPFTGNHFVLSGAIPQCYSRQSKR